MLTLLANNKKLRACLLFAWFGPFTAFMFSQAPAIAGPVWGKILGPDGSPIEGATVVIHSTSDEAEAQRTDTDRGGQYRFEKLRPGPYKLSASAEGYVNSEPRSVTVGSAGIRADFRLSQAEAAGTGSTTKQNQNPPLTFSVAGAHGSTAPSGYSTGLSAEETAQVEATVFDAPLLDTFLDTVHVDCGVEPLLLRDLARAPASFSANHAMGKFYLNTGNYAKAVPYLEAAHSANAGEVGNAVDLAVAYIAVGRGPSAVTLLERNGMPQSRVSKYLRLMALAYWSCGAADKAVEMMRKAAGVDSSADNQYDCGMELIQLGELNEALDLFRRATTDYPQSSSLWLGLGIAEQLTDRKQDAISALFRSADADRDSVRPLLVLSQITGLSEERTSELRKRLAEHLGANPNDSDAHFAYALVLYHRQAEDSASMKETRTHLARALELNPSLAQAHFVLGQIDSDGNDVQKAIEQFVEGLKIAPRSPQAHYRLSRLYRRNGQVDAAREEMKLYLELHGKGTEAEPNDAADLTGVLTQHAATRRACGP